jgi:hypothetical protein
MGNGKPAPGHPAQKQAWQPTLLRKAAKDLTMTVRNGLDSLLRPQDSVLVLIDHQPYQLANLNSHEPQMVVNNTVGLAKLPKAFRVPTILTSVIADRGGLIFPQITEVFPGQESIDRTLVASTVRGASLRSSVPADAGRTRSRPIVPVAMPLALGPSVLLRPSRVPGRTGRLQNTQV